MTSQGHARTAFRRAIERGNVVVAEVRRAKSGQLDLSEALELTALVAQRDRERSRRFAVRWLQRWLEESKAPTVEDAVMVVCCLAALGGERHAEAVNSRRALSSWRSTPFPA
jgi:hypothetical protein